MYCYDYHSEKELILLLRDGDAKAYTEIYDRYFQLMFVFAYKKVRDEDLAKDFVQELFTDVWKKRSELVEDTVFASFLYVALRYKILNHFAHQKVQNKFTDFISFHDTEVSSVRADHLIRDKQLREYIEKQIQLLPSKMRRMFELSRKEHLSHKEIAALVNTSEFTVSKQISNALKILKGKVGRALTILFFV